MLRAQCQSVGKLLTFSNHPIYNIFSLTYYKLLGLLGEAIQIFTRSNLDSVLSKIFSETEAKNGMHRCFSLNCLFEISL